MHSKSLLCQTQTVCENSLCTFFLKNKTKNNIHKLTNSINNKNYAIMKKLTIIKVDGTSLTLNFNTEEACSKVFNCIMTTCDRKEIAQINIINIEI